MTSALAKIIKPILSAAIIAMFAHVGTALAQEAPATVSPNQDSGSAASLLGAPEDSSRIDEFLKQYESTPLESATPAVAEAAVAEAAVVTPPATDIPAVADVVLPSTVSTPPSTRPHIRPATLMDSYTEARADVAGCADCAAAARNAPEPIEVVPDPTPAPVQGNFHSAQERCLASAILAGAKSNVRSRYGNRPSSHGVCALGVRTSLNAAGAYTGGGLGNAVDYHTSGRLTSIGFRNFIDQYPNPEVAPPGAVLVFSGPNTSTYLRNGYEGPRGRKGDWVGHVTVKGDDGRYYTDGRTDEPALYWPSNQTRRRLVGVYLMQRCVQCSSALRRQCGG